jgi:hypothetical protein
MLVFTEISFVAAMIGYTVFLGWLYPAIITEYEKSDHYPLRNNQHRKPMNMLVNYNHRNNHENSEYLDYTTNTNYQRQHFPRKQSPETTAKFSPKAWIVQGDSTPLEDTGVYDTLSNTTDWMNLMATVNLRYATIQGYGYTRFIFEDKESCIHPVYGKRHIAWCKLLAIAKMMQTVPSSVEHLVWIDTDAMLQQHHWDIPTLIDSVPSGCRESRYCKTKECYDHKRESALIVAANHPFCGEAPLTAFQIWNLHRSNTWKILQDWWNSPRCATEHPWEQRAFARDVYHKHALNDTGGGVAILYQDVNHPKKAESALRKQYLRHVGHFLSLNGAGQRLPHAQNVTHYLNMTNSEYQQLQHQLHHRIDLLAVSDRALTIPCHIELLTVDDMIEMAENLATITNADQPLRNETLDCEYVVNEVMFPSH